MVGVGEARRWSNDSGGLIHTLFLDVKWSVGRSPAAAELSGGARDAAAGWSREKADGGCFLTVVLARAGSVRRTAADPAGRRDSVELR